MATGITVLTAPTSSPATSPVNGAPSMEGAGGPQPAAGSGAASGSADDDAAVASTPFEDALADATRDDTDQTAGDERVIVPVDPGSLLPRDRPEAADEIAVSLTAVGLKPGSGEVRGRETLPGAVAIDSTDEAALTLRRAEGAAGEGRGGPAQLAELVQLRGQQEVLAEAGDATDEAVEELEQTLQVAGRERDLVRSAREARVNLPVNGQVGDPEFRESLVQQVRFLVNQKLGLARLHVTPPELGPVDVRMNINGSETSVHFSSPSAATRDALEQALPRLRDMLAEFGFDLAESGVDDQSREQSGERREHSGEPEELLPDEQERVVTRRDPSRLVDAFA